MPEITEGNPKMPLPMMQLTISAARLQRPMARRSVGWERASGTSGLYHTGLCREKTSRAKLGLFLALKLRHGFQDRHQLIHYRLLGIGADDAVGDDSVGVDYQVRGVGADGEGVY